MKKELIKRLQNTTNESITKELYTEIYVDIHQCSSNIQEFVESSCMILTLMMIENIKNTNSDSLKITKSLFELKLDKGYSYILNKDLKSILIDRIKDLDNTDLSIIAILHKLLFTNNPISRKIINNMRERGYKTYFTNTEDRSVLDFNIELDWRNISIFEERDD